MQCNKLTTAILILGLPSLALAAPQQPGSPPKPQQTPRATATDEVATYASVSKLIGANVWARADAEGDREDVADINDFIVDATTGKVDFVILSSGGVGSLGDTLRRVPFSDLSIEHQDDDECKVMIAVGKDEFERIAKIEEDSLEPYRAKTIAAGTRDQGAVREAGGQKDTTGVTNAQMRVSGAILASDLDDLEVRAPMGAYGADGKPVKADELGSIDEAWLNTVTGNIEYLTFEYKDRKLVMPHRALTSHIDADNKELYFTAPAVADRLATAPAFDDAKKWDLKNAEFRRTVDSFYADMKGAAEKAGDAVRKAGDKVGDKIGDGK